MPTLSELLSGNEVVAQLVLQHLQPNMDASSASQWPPNYRAWLYMVLQVNKALTVALDKDYLWEAYFDVQCAHLRSPFARFFVTTAACCKYRHRRCTPPDVTVNLTFSLADTARSFARQTIPQFVLARDKLYEYFPPYDVPGSVFVWEPEDTPWFADDELSDSEEIHCGRVYYVGDIPVRLHHRPSSLAVLHGDIDGLNADLNADTSPVHSFECSECGEEQHSLFLDDV